MPLKNTHKPEHHHQNVAAKLMDTMTKPPILVYPNVDCPFILHTNSSNDGLGAVLYQRQDNKLRVIGYGSRTLTPAEINDHLHLECSQGYEYILILGDHFTKFMQGGDQTRDESGKAAADKLF